MGKTLIPASKNKLADGGKFVLFFGLSEAKTDDAAGLDGKPKHEIVITALQEGPGNARDKRYYTREAVVNSEGVFKARRKLFVNHLEEGKAASSEDLRNWCATLKETWTEPMPNGLVARKVRLKIHEEWLWTRCLEAPEEIALSIEGAGAGKEVVIEGQPFMAIEKIWSLNATKFVTYPGNAKMGADLVESAAGTLEDTDMDLKALTEALLRDGRPDLITAIVTAAEAPLKAKLAEAEAKFAALSESATDGSKANAKIQEQVAELKKAMTSTIDELRNKLAEAERKADASEVRERLRGKKELVDRKLAESKLVAEAKTPLFVARLYAIVEKKDGDKVVTVEAQVDAEIAEQMRLITAEFGSIRAAGANGTEEATGVDQLSEEEQMVYFRNTVLHQPLTLEQFRANKKAAAEKVAAK